MIIIFWELLTLHWFLEMKWIMLMKMFWILIVQLQPYQSMSWAYCCFLSSFFTISSFESDERLKTFIASYLRKFLWYNQNNLYMKRHLQYFHLVQLKKNNQFWNYFIVFFQMELVYIPMKPSYAYKYIEVLFRITQVCCSFASREGCMKCKVPLK